MMLSVFAAAALLFGPAVAEAPPPSVKPQVGDAYEVVSDREESSTRDGTSSGSSSDVDAIVERVLAVRDDGVELTVDLAAASAADRASQWQLPARFLVTSNGTIRLLDWAKLESRVDPWLKSGGLTRAACGHLIFTWNAFRIECDPDSALKIFAAFDLQPRDLRDGAPFVDPSSNENARLVKMANRVGGATFTAEVTINPDVIRRERAKTDVGVGELTGKPVSFDAALLARAQEIVTGTVKITFDADPAGQVRRRTRLTRYSVVSPGKGAETHTIMQTLERRRLG